MKPILSPFLVPLCSMLGVTAQAQKVTDPINDCLIFASLCVEGGRLMEDG